MKTKRLHPTVIATGWVSFFNDVASEMIYPLMPVFLNSVLGIGTAFIGAIEGAAESLNSFVKLFSGWLSDRAGKKRQLVMFGYGIAAVARPLIGIAAAWWQVLGLRLADRFGKGVRGAPRDALVADVTDRDQRGRAFGFQRAMDHAGAVVGPLIASALLWIFQMGERDYWILFLISALPGAAAMVIVWGWIREPESLPGAAVPHAATSHAENSGSNNSIPLHDLIGFWRAADQRLKTLILIIGLFALGNSTDAFLILRAQQMGVSVALIPILWAVHHVSKSALSVPGGILSDRFGRRPAMIAGWGVYGLVYLGFAFASAAWMAWVLFIMYGIYFALTEGVERAFVADLAGTERRGLAFGFYYFVLGLAALPASVLFGAVWRYVSYQAAFIMGAALALLAAVLLMAVRAEKKR